MSLFEEDEVKEVSPIENQLTTMSNEETKSETKLDEAILKPKIKLKRKEKQEVKK